MATLIVYANIVIGAAAFTIYGMWAGKWLRRKAWQLFVLNAATSMIIGLFALGYATIAQEYGFTPALGPGFIHYFIPLVVGVPVWARITEYRRDEQRERYAKGVLASLREKMSGDNAQP